MTSTYKSAAFALALVCFLALAAPKAQTPSNGPITREKLLAALESMQSGKSKRQDAAWYVKRISESKVTFHLTGNDERKIRVAGRYLGRNGLDDVILAIRKNALGDQTMTNEKSKQTPSISQTMTNSPGGIQAGGSVTINQAQKPWRLTDEQRGQFLEILKANPKGPVVVRCMNGDVDSCAIAEQIVNVLRAAGWTITSFNSITLFRSGPDQTPPKGIHLNASTDLPQHADALFQALKAIGVPVEGTTSPGFPVGKLDVMVGVRPE